MGERARADNLPFKISLPRESVKKLDLHAAERTVKVGTEIYRTDLIREAVAEYIERHGL